MTIELQDRKAKASTLLTEGPRLKDFDWRKPRPAGTIMRPERLAACFPGALSFARTLFDRFAETQWKLEKVRIDFDADGKGELLYRLTDGRHDLHFFVISNFYSAGDKADRSYNMNWDGTAALCEGQWSPAREDFLRREIPKQRFGRLDHQTLAYTRGNRSGRIFDHVVESLAEGQQPDGSRLAAIGYIFRTTGFTANGFISMRSYLGMEENHILAGPYHAQMCSAFLMREYVADLVDAMAKARNPAAAKLSPEMRRYLGIGNSAGLGLTPFVYNHPMMIHHWTRQRELALAEARATPVAAGDAAVARFAGLVRKAQRFFLEDPRDGNQIFLPYEVISREMGLLLAWFEALPDLPPDLWCRVAQWAEDNLQFETIEAVNVILLELYPGKMAAFTRDLTVDEALDFDPAASVGDLRRLIDGSYGWMAADYADILDRSPRFWYMSTEAPYEPRIGQRGPLPDYEFESNMDAPRRFGMLRQALEGAGDGDSLAAFLLARPDLRNIVNRLWSLRDCAYADIRDNTLRADYNPAPATRFMLSHYGMDKLDASPRGVRGVLMQGAPIAEDLEARNRGDWPFPLAPGAAEGPSTVEPYRAPIDQRATALRKLEVWKETDFGDEVMIAPVELLRWNQRALQVGGAELGHAIRCGDLLHLYEICFGGGIRLALDCSAKGTIGIGPVSVRAAGEGGFALDPVPGESAALLAPSLLDFACKGAAEAGRGLAFARGVSHAVLADVLPLWADRRGCDCAVLRRQETGWHVVVGQGEGEGLVLHTAMARAAAEVLDGLPAEAETADLMVLCWRRDGSATIATAAARHLTGGERIPTGARIAAAYRGGLRVSLKALETLRDTAFLTLVPVEIEAPISTE